MSKRRFLKANWAALESNKQLEVRATSCGGVLVRKGEKWAEDEVAAGAGAGAGAGAAAAGKRTENRRINKATAGKIESSGKIGGDFAREQSPKWLDERSEYFDELFNAQQERFAGMERVPIKITMPDGAQKDGVAFETTPMKVALSIAKGLAKKCLVAVVTYTERLTDAVKVADVEEEEEEHDHGTEEGGELWDMGRPLEGSCKLLFKTYDDAEGQMVFKHSSAHILGASLEAQFGVHLCIGPPTQDGFYYDAYMGDEHITDAEHKAIEKAATRVVKQAYKFDRLTLTKDQALELFKHNPFKVQLIKNKVPDGAFTSAYRCGKLIDLCMGPHLPNTNKVKCFKVAKCSSAYWLGSAENDSLQRVYGVAFPDNKLMKQYKLRMAEAKKRDHRLIGVKQELFFFNELSPGSCFFLPHGAHIYNKLVDFIKSEYRVRGYTEVVTPNVFSTKLWKTSGHYEHYKEDMFMFKSEKMEFGLKPMNCPGHCVMFAHRVRSHRELPVRFADFGVLHRNEASGSLSGLTRVRRFQQDDAHIFCRVDQIEQEVNGVLEFMAKVYTVFGFEFKLFLSTRPKKAMGDVEVWNRAEAMMKLALDGFGHPWSLNPGDGAFYGPKIDIQVFDALGRAHQCATIQLDFQLPIRFDLNYKTAEKDINARPVIVHRAILGSVERLMGVITEHTGGKWPFWLSPRQAMVVPVDPVYQDYAASVAKRLYNAGFEATADLSGRKLGKMVRMAQQAQFNFILVVGERERDTDSVTIRVRDAKAAQPEPTPVDEVIAAWTKLVKNPRHDQ